MKFTQHILSILFSVLFVFVSARANFGAGIQINLLPPQVAVGDSYVAVASGGTAPYTWYSSDTTIARIDSLTGKFIALRRGIVDIHAADSLLIEGILTVTVFDMKGGFRDTVVAPKDTIIIPFYVQDLTGKGIVSQKVDVFFNPAVMSYAGFVQEGTLSSTSSIQINSSTNILQIGMASGNDFAGGGVLFKLKFHPIVLNGTSWLTVTHYEVNEPGLTTPTMLGVNGAVHISDTLNTPPVFLSVPKDTAMIENDSINVFFKAFDDDGDSIKYIYVAPLPKPAGLFFDSFSGRLAWRPDLNQQGLYPFYIKAVDGKNGTAFATFNLVVNNLNVPPVFLATVPDTIFLTEGTSVTAVIGANDFDNDTISFLIPSPPAGLTISFLGYAGNISKAEMQWTPTFFQSGMYPVDIIIDDKKGGTAIKKIIFVVNDVNRPPGFSNTFPDTFIVSVGKNFGITVVASDPDADTLMFGLTNAPAGMTIQPDSGIISWTPMDTQVGSFLVEIIASDRKGGIAARSQWFRVINANRLPQFMIALPDTTISENQQIDFSYSALDLDGDSLQWKPISIPFGATFANGNFSWKPSFDQSGKYPIIVSISDQFQNVIDTAFITVMNINRAPLFRSTLSDTTLQIDSTLQFTYTGSDPDFDTITFKILKAPVSAKITSSGQLTWKPAAADIGIDTIIVALNDNALTVFDTAFVTVYGFPFAVVEKTDIDFGTIISGFQPSVSSSIVNTGYTPLVLTKIQQGNSLGNFTTDTASVIILQPGQKRQFNFTYHPLSIGSHVGSFLYQTNDPKHQSIVFSLKGTAISKSQLTKKILVDDAHSSSIALRDTVSGMTKLFSYLGQSGFKISFAETTMTPSGFDGVLIASPQKHFSRSEITAIQQYISNGGLVVMLGNSSRELGTNSVLNEILSDTTWKTGISLMNNTVADSISNFHLNPESPLITQFADTAHPYLHKIDSLVFFNAADVLVNSPAIPFARYTHPAVSSTGQTAIALSQIGKGKLLVFGDATLWQNENVAVSHSQSENITALDNLAFALNIFSVTENYTVKLPAATPNEEYRLVSIPFELNNADIKTVLKDLGDVNPLNWRLFGRYNTALQKYLEFPSDGFTSFRRGEAYWLITRGEKHVTFGDATINPTQDFFPITIGPGYSMIGNPFPYQVSWKNSRKGDSVQMVLWKYTSNGFQPESLVLEPFSGYFVKNLSKDSVTLYINPVEAGPASLPKSDIARSLLADEWMINIAASSGKIKDDINIAGVHHGAKKELDQFDVAEPPAAPSDYLIVRFDNSSWQKYSGNYAVDIRPVSNEGLYWDFSVISSTKQSKVALELSPEGTVPPDFDLYLIDRATERAYPINGTTTIDIAMNKNENRREFRLLAGNDQYVEKNTNGIPLVPMQFSVAQNYPNPFNPSTLIRYTLGHSGDVSVAIYNVLGQKVKTLRNEFQPIGTYSVEWDGKDESERTVASGVYFYKIMIDSQGERLFTETKKMILMK